MEGHGLRLLIRWKDGSADDITLPRQATTGRHWLPSETDSLLSLIDNQATQLEIASEFPNRQWRLIRNKVLSIRGKGVLRPRPKPIKDNESYLDYLKRVEGASLVDMGFVTGSATPLPCPGERSLPYMLRGVTP